MKVPFVTLKFQHEKLKNEIFSKWEELYNRTEFVHGRTGEEFEADLAEFSRTKHAIALDSGTSAIEIALRAAGIGTGDEVVTTSNTFIATVAGIHFTGAKPVFADIDPATWNIDPNEIEKHITPATKAIMPVNLYGQPADLVTIRKIADKHNLIIVNDAAQSIGSGIVVDGKWRSTTEFSDTTIYSFYPGKNLGACGEGGAIVTNNDEFAEFCDMFKDHGSVEKYIHEFPGRTHRMHAMQSAALQIKLRHINEWNNSRKQAAKLYKELLADVKEIQLPYNPENIDPIYHLFVILVENRDDFMAYMESKGIATALHYKMPVHLQKAFANLNIKKGSLPITENTVSRNVSLPMFPEITEEQIRYVCDTIKEYFNR